MSLGWSQILIVALLVVLLFGRGKISAVMGDVAKGIKSFKRGLADDTEDDTEPRKAIEDKPAAKVETANARENLHAS